MNMSDQNQEQVEVQGSLLRSLVDTRDRQIQKARIQFGNRLSAIDRQADGASPRQRAILVKWCEHFEQLEKSLDKDIAELAGEYVIFEHVTSVRGVGKLLAAKLIAMIDIHVPDTPSALWKYAGYSVTDGERDRPRKGEKLPYNSRLKSTCYLIGVSMIRTGSPYRQVYDAAKEQYNATRPDWSPSRIHMAAMRKMIKIFLVHLWLVWRELEGLPTRQPYVQEKLGHTHIITPQEMGWPPVG